MSIPRKTLEGIAGVSLALGVPVFLVLVVLLFTRTDDRGCSNVEFTIQNASKCAALPHMWAEWSRLDQIYGTSGLGGASAETCPTLLATARRLGVSRSDLLLIWDWTESKKGGIPTYWKRQLGIEFCTDADRRGWLTAPKNL